MGDIREAKEQAPISKRDETIIYVVFVIVMLSLFFGTQIGNLMYVMPAIGVIVLLVTKAMSVKDTVGAMTQDAIWMAAGVLVMANALGDSGAGAIIGNFILTILGGNPNSIMVLFVFAIVTTVMTTFMSNAATRNVLIPIAASTCLAAGWDPGASSASFSSAPTSPSPSRPALPPAASPMVWAAIRSPRPSSIPCPS